MGTTISLRMMMTLVVIILSFLPNIAFSQSCWAVDSPFKYSIIDGGLGPKVQCDTNSSCQVKPSNFSAPTVATDFGNTYNITPTGGHIGLWAKSAGQTTMTVDWSCPGISPTEFGSFDVDITVYDTPLMVAAPYGFYNYQLVLQADVVAEASCSYPDAYTANFDFYNIGGYVVLDQQGSSDRNVGSCDGSGNCILSQKIPAEEYRFTLNSDMSGSGTTIYDGCTRAVTFTPIAEKVLVDGSSQVNFEGSTTVGDPINTATGELYFYENADFLLKGGTLPLQFQRYYASQLVRDGYGASHLGNNWAHEFAWFINFVGSDTLSVNSPQGKIVRFTKGVAGWATSKAYPVGYQLVYDSTNFEYSFVDPRSDVRYLFDFNGRLIRVEDGQGGTHSFTYDSEHKLTQVNNSFGNSLAFFYSAENRISNVTDGRRNVAFTYDAATGDLLSASDFSGALTTYSYDNNFAGEGKMITRTLPQGNTPYRQAYINSPGKALHGRVINQWDANDNKTSIAFPTQGGAGETAILDPQNNIARQAYIATGEVVGISDPSPLGNPAGPSFAMGYNSAGKRTSLTDRLGDTTSYQYHAESGNLSSITRADGSVITYSYSARTVDGITYYDRTAITHADTSSEGFIYDGLGNLTSHTDQVGNAIGYTYNTNGQPTSVTNAMGGVSTTSYNTDGTQASASDVSGNVTTLAYDAFKRVKQITFADASKRSFSHAVNDQLLTSTDENGNATTMAYDLNGNLNSISDPLGSVTIMSYDGNDRPVTVTDPLSNTISTTYDSLGRVATVTNAKGGVTTSGYDSQGRLISVTDPMTNIWTTSYDLEAIPTSSTDPLGNITTFTSDNMGRITEIVTPLGNSSSAAYDAMGRMASSTDAMGNVITFTRDARGQLASVNLPEGIKTSYQHNALGNLTQITDPNGNNWLREFDNQGRLISSSDPLGQQKTITYNNRNHPSTISYAGGLGTLNIGYDAAGHTISRDYSDGTKLNYSYNANGRLIAANGITNSVDANSNIINSNGIGVVYDAGGRIVDMTLAANKSLSYLYDANDRLISVSDWVGGKTQFSYDAAGRLTGVIRPNGINRSNQYDVDSQLVGFSEGSNTSVTLTRDAKGQIITATRNVPLKASASTVNDATNSFDVASQVMGSTYDAMGRATFANGNSYTWDLASRLTSYIKRGSNVSALYDAAGYRLSRTENSTTRDYVWNYALTLPSVAIERQAGSDSRYYVHTPTGELLYSIDPITNTRAFYHFDEMGNTLFISDDSGATIASYAYTPFGIPLAATGGLDNPYTWQGKFGVMDEGDGFYYIRARYYDAVSGRFISRDPIKGKSPKSVNPYQYVFNNPLSLIDARGKDPKEINEDFGGIAVALLGALLKGDTPAGAMASGFCIGNDLLSLKATYDAKNGDLTMRDIFLGGGSNLIGDIGLGILTITGSTAAAPVGIVAAVGKTSIDIASELNEVNGRIEGYETMLKVQKIRSKIAHQARLDAGVQAEASAKAAADAKAQKIADAEAFINGLLRFLDMAQKGAEAADKAVAKNALRGFADLLTNGTVISGREANQKYSPAGDGCSCECARSYGATTVGDNGSDVDSAADDIQGIVVLL